jgi:hypothetical protein
MKSSTVLLLVLAFISVSAFVEEKKNYEEVTLLIQKQTKWMLKKT